MAWPSPGGTRWPADGRQRSLFRIAELADVEHDSARVEVRREGQRIGSGPLGPALAANELDGVGEFVDRDLGTGLRGIEAHPNRASDRWTSAGGAAAKAGSWTHLTAIHSRAHARATRERILMSARAVEPRGTPYEPVLVLPV